uniref:Ovule protein n=1 Tax=Heterorhabditis bacteriophora TaxID=37862 RepID=A0A1I7W699_HETBA
MELSLIAMNYLKFMNFSEYILSLSGRIYSRRLDTVGKIAEWLPNEYLTAVILFIHERRPRVHTKSWKCLLLAL